MIIGYARVSTKQQSALRQENYLRENGAERIYIDICTGKTKERPELKKMLNFIREGDVLIVEAIDRLARDSKDLITIMRNLTADGVVIKFLKQDLDTSTEEGRAIIKFVGKVVESDTILARERQMEGIELAKERGVYKGRKPIKCSNWDKVIPLWVDGYITAVEAMKRLNLKPSTFYRKVQEAGIKKKNNCEITI